MEFLQGPIPYSWRLTVGLIVSHPNSLTNRPPESSLAVTWGVTTEPSHCSRTVGETLAMNCGFATTPAKVAYGVFEIVRIRDANDGRPT